MNNKIKGNVFVEVSAFGAIWKLQLTTNALCELESALGFDISILHEKLSDPTAQKLSIVRLVIWAACLTHHPDTTKMQAGNIMDEIGLTRASEIMAEALLLAFPESKEGEVNPIQATAL
jgi:hypothetical protein